MQGYAKFVYYSISIYMQTPITPIIVSTKWANAHELLSSNPIPGMDLGASYFLKRFGFDKLDSFYQRGQGKFDFLFGSLLSGKFSERILPAGDREVLKNEVQKKCDELYRLSGKNIIWVETTGQADLTKTNKSKMRLSTFASSTSPFEVSGIFRIRKLEPYESPSGVLPKGVSLGRTLQVPCNAALAAAMAPGSIFEVTCEGQANLKLENPLGVKAIRKQNISLKIQKLPQKNKVIVRVITGKGFEGNLNYQQHYNPSWSFGSLGQSLMEGLGLLSWFRPSSATAEAKRLSNERHIKQYTLDLSNKEQAQAYEEIFRKFSIQKAEALEQKQNGIQTEAGYELNASAMIGDTPITFYRILESEKNTDFAQIQYQESKTITETISKWFKKVSITWEWISFKNPTSENRQQSYCHLTYHSPHASDFFYITDSLGIDILQDARVILANYHKTEFHADIFLTNMGIKNIQSSSFREAFETYSGLSGEPHAIRYAQLQNKYFFSRLFHYREINELEKLNPSLKDSRNILAKAYAFASKVQPFKGSLKRFSDTQSIVSLMKLAKPGESIIHELSLMGPGIALANLDEGQIVHPEQELALQFSV